MGAALICDVGDVHNAGAALTAATFTAPSSNVVRNTAFGADIELVGMWRNGVTKGQARITSPKIVPVGTGINYYAPAGCTGDLFRLGPNQGLTPQDILTCSLTGGAAEDDQIALQSYYASLPGVSMSLKSPGDINSSSDFTFAWPVAAAAGAAIGQQGNTLITTTVDSSTGNTWYALLGYTVDAIVTAVGITGVDTSQSFVGGPGLLDVYKTEGDFWDKSVANGLPMIPCFNSANKASTYVTVVDVVASTAVNVTLILAQMNPGWTP